MFSLTEFDSLGVVMIFLLGGTFYEIYFVVFLGLVDLITSIGSIFDTVVSFDLSSNYSTRRCLPPVFWHS